MSEKKKKKRKKKCSIKLQRCRTALLRCSSTSEPTFPLFALLSMQQWLNREGIFGGATEILQAGKAPGPFTS